MRAWKRFVNHFRLYINRIQSSNLPECQAARKKLSREHEVRLHLPSPAEMRIRVIIVHTCRGAPHMYSKGDGVRAHPAGNWTFGDDPIRLVLRIHASSLQLARQHRTLSFVEPPFVAMEGVRMEVPFSAESERAASGALGLALVLPLLAMVLDERQCVLSESIIYGECQFVLVHGSFHR